MTYLLDSDVAIDHLADDGPAQRLLARLALDGLTISVITNMEVSQGVLASPNPVLAGAKLALSRRAADCPLVCGSRPALCPSPH
jgi:predicted nucleic acid-binding protein